MKPLDKLKKLHESTTQDDWYTVLVWKPDTFEVYTNSKQICQAVDSNDAKFIVESHKMVPRLIKALEKCMEQRNVWMRNSCTTDEMPWMTSNYNKELEQILEGK